MIFFEGWTIPHAKANCSNLYLYFEIALVQQDKPFNLASSS
jgi:hypothetical protein